MADRRILALSLLFCIIQLPSTSGITSSGQALHEPCHVAEIAIVPVRYATLSSVNFGENVL
ncbi:MAG TPA: hypothetical protein DD706_05775 [Nitrospiraceae bacterium]|nr:hypothetical protein [Nitrospiraceae bacterium]